MFVLREIYFRVLSGLDNYQRCCSVGVRFLYTIYFNSTAGELSFVASNMLEGIVFPVIFAFGVYFLENREEIF